MEYQSVVVNKEEEMVDLPPGFRFHPTDEEIITHYLTPKVVNTTFAATAIGEVDLNKCEPWDLPERAKMGEKEWYFFCRRDRKYPTGTRTNRATESGYWKATGKDKEIFKKLGKGSCVVGMKKTLVFYCGRAPKGEKTNWVMHEFRLHGNEFSYYNLPNKIPKDDWVVSRVFRKSCRKVMIPGTSENGLSSIRMKDKHLNSSSPPPLVDPARPSSSFCTDHQSGFDEEDDDNREYNYYTSLDHHYNNNNAYHMIMSQFNNSCPNPVFPMIPSLDVDRQMCKTEQLSSNHDSTRSQDTGLSTDVNNNATEISSSKHNNIGVLFPDIIVADIDGLWDF